MEPKKASDPDELGGWRINGRLVKVALELFISGKRVLKKLLSR